MSHLKNKVVKLLGPRSHCYEVTKVTFEPRQFGWGPTAKVCEAGGLALCLHTEQMLMTNTVWKDEAPSPSLGPVRGYTIFQAGGTVPFPSCASFVAPETAWAQVRAALGLPRNWQVGSPGRRLEMHRGPREVPFKPSWQDFFHIATDPRPTASPANRTTGSGHCSRPGPAHSAF